MTSRTLVVLENLTLIPTTAFTNSNFTRRGDIYVPASINISDGLDSIYIGASFIKGETLKNLGQYIYISLTNIPGRLTKTIKLAKVSAQPSNSIIADAGTSRSTSPLPYSAIGYVVIEVNFIALTSANVPKFPIKVASI